MCGCGHVLCTPILSPRPEDPSYPQHLLHLSAAPVPPLPSICSTSPQHLFHLSPAPALPLPSTCSTYPQHLFHLSGYPPAILRLSPGYPPQSMQGPVGSWVPVGLGAGRGPSGRYVRSTRSAASNPFVETRSNKWRTRNFTSRC